MSTYLLNQNFACEIEMMHISFVNLRVTEIALVSLTEELVGFISSVMMGRDI